MQPSAEGRETGRTTSPETLKPCFHTHLPSVKRLVFGI